MSVGTSQHTVTARPRRSALSAAPPTAVLLAGLAALFFVSAAITPSWLATHSPLDTDLLAALTPPGSDHPLGTDDIGRDLYSRIIWGTRESLLIGVGAMVVALAGAIVLGFSAALGPKWIAEPINRLLEILLAFPTLLLALLFVALLGASPTSLLVSVGIGTAPGYARLIRAQTLKVKTSAYVEAARALGHSGRTVFLQHIAPNAFRPLVALVALGIGQSVVWASGLSFLGLGVAPPSSEWGALLEAGKANITIAWWLEAFPGLVIVLVALSFGQIGQYVQDRLEGTARS